MKLRNIWLLIYFGFLLWSGINPKDRFTWFLEIFPAIIALLVLVLTYKKFRLTPLLYFLILIHCTILMIGGHYTYAEVPFFDYFKELFGWSRNNYDKVGHFAQGFVPAIAAIELIIRKKLVNGEFWQKFFAVCFCLAFSAFYELFEWWVAILSGENADAFLGTQGYAWDTQSDMGFALLGAVVSIMTMKTIHSNQIRNLERH